MSEGKMTEFASLDLVYERHYGKVVEEMGLADHSDGEPGLSTKLDAQLCGLSVAEKTMIGKSLSIS